MSWTSHRDLERAITGENRLDDVTFLASGAFLAGVVLPFVDGRVSGAARLLPDDLFLALCSLLLGSAFFYGYGSAAVSLAAGARLSAVFKPFADTVYSMVDMVNTLGQVGGPTGGSLATSAPITMDIFYRTAAVLLCGVFACAAAARFGAGIHYDKNPVGPLAVFAVSAAALYYIGVW